ncbi:MAG: hypothetical protein HY682_10640 [Chloroflexi bacterium]|nr:hypothetical protein [Chloroflexota bacterium]
MIRLEILLASTTVRAVVGLGLAWLLAFGGYLLSLTLIFPGTPRFTVMTPTVVTLMGLGAGTGAAFAWLRWDYGWKPNLSLASFGIVAGLIGAWSGFLIGSPRSFDELIPQIGVSATATGGIIAANLAAGAFFVASALKRRDLRAL